MLNFREISAVTITRVDHIILIIVIKATTHTCKKSKDLPQTHTPDLENYPLVVWYSSSFESHHISVVKKHRWTQKLTYTVHDNFSE